MLEINNWVEAKQNGVQMYLCNITSEELIDNTYVDMFSKSNPDGYQRHLIRAHYIAIANYLMISDNPLLPTAVLLAVDKEPEYDRENARLILPKSMRVVDGQHRIEAIKHIKSSYSYHYKKMQDMSFPVLIMVLNKTKPLERRLEIQSFIDINKKGKKVSTDLALSLLQRINQSRLVESKSMVVDEAKLYVSLEVAKKLNEDKKSIWYESIKIGDGEVSNKPISINAFSKSILEMVEFYLKKHESVDKKEVDELVEILAGILNEYWKQIAKQWEYAFAWDQTRDCYTFDKDYNIMKGIGVYPLHIILREMQNEKTDLSGSLEQAVKIIKNSQLGVKHWKRGGRLSYYNSASGFEQIAKFISNREKTII